MKVFNSFNKFADHLASLAIKEVSALQVGLKKVAQHIEKVAKDEIGYLQPAVGNFPKWDELAESTKDDKLRKGYVFNEEYNPLLRTGDLRDSISNEVKGLEAAVGSTSQIMVYQEFGTATIPARPVIGSAAFRSKEKIKEIVGVAAVTGLVSGTNIHPKLSYNFDTKE